MEERNEAQEWPGNNWERRQVENWGGENSVETERLGLETGMHWGRMEVESWGGVERDLKPGKKLEKMGRGWDDMGEK